MSKIDIKLNYKEDKAKFNKKLDKLKKHLNKKSTKLEDIQNAIKEIELVIEANEAKIKKLEQSSSTMQTREGLYVNKCAISIENAKLSMNKVVYLILVSSLENKKQLQENSVNNV